MKPFLVWLANQVGRDDPIGDLAGDMRDDPPPSHITTPEQFHDWVACRHIYVAHEALQAIIEAGAEWRSRSSKREGLSLKTRFVIFQRDGFTCQLCGRSAKDGARLEVDHKQAVAKGGGNDEDNLWTLCFECNRGKRDRNL